jgi:hypothetical protein
MDIKKVLLSGYSKESVDVLVCFIEDDAEKFSELMDMVFGEDKVLSQRASWVMTECIERFPYLGTPYIKVLLETLEQPNTKFHVSVIRHIARSFQFIAPPDKYDGRIIDLAFKLIMDRKAAVAVRAYAITILENYVSIYPELKEEFIQVLLLEMDDAPAAFKSRARKIISSDER